MTAKLSDRALEGSTYGIQVDFVLKGSDGEVIPFTPNNDLNWTLTDEHGVVINGRYEVSLVPDETVIIPLSGADLFLDGDYPTQRTVTVKATFDSVLGTDLDFLAAVRFQIENLINPITPEPE